MSLVESWSWRITWFSLELLSTMSIPTFLLWFMFFFDVLFFFMAGLHDVIVGWLLRRCQIMVFKQDQYRIQYRINTRRHGRPRLIYVFFGGWGTYICTHMYTIRMYIYVLLVMVWSIMNTSWWIHDLWPHPTYTLHLTPITLGSMYKST